MNIDEAKLVFDKFYPEWIENKIKIETEQDVRLQVIDLILTEVLGWRRSDIQTEPHFDSGYVDYLLKADNRNRFVIEAKRVSKLLVDSRNQRVAFYKANGSALNSAQEGLQQAKRYCSDTGVMFSALTTGFEWIGYWAIRTDGKVPYEGKAVVFPTLESVNDKFALFYDMFSKEGIISNLYQVHIHESEGLQVHHIEKLAPVIDKNEVRLLQKSKMAADLENIFKQFFSTMSGVNDPEMLAKCFVESKESREADVSLEKIANNLINRIDVVDSHEGDELQEHIRVAVESQRGEFVLVIGNKGAGKSTFIDRFFRLVLEKSLRDRCLVIRVDLADSGGDVSNIDSWLTHQIRKEIEISFFGKRNPTFEELQGIFFSEYNRWQTGEHKFLYERNKQEFKEKFGAYIADIVDNQEDKYVRRLLRDAVLSRKLMPSIVFDNTDHFPQEFQERIFQYAQSVHRANLSFVICPITDRTIWQLSKSGPLQSYDTRAFYLPVPSTKDVLEKRVSFLKEKLEEDAKKEKGDYFLAKGIRLSIKDLNAFAACIDDIFVKTEYISRMVGWLSNHDIRRSLNISQRIITSPIVSMEDLIKTFLAENRLNIPKLKIKQALIFGDYSQFNQDANDYVLNVFSVRPDDVTSPLLKISILRVLMDKEFQSSDAESAYMMIEEVQNYFEPCGIPRRIINQHVRDLLRCRLIEPYDPTDNEVYEDQRVRVTHSGQIHYEFTQNDDVYLTSMSLTTDIRDMDLIAEIRDIKKGRNGKIGKDEWMKIIMIFVEYMLKEDEKFVVLPNLDTYSGQIAMRLELRQKWFCQSKT